MFVVFVLEIIVLNSNSHEIQRTNQKKNRIYLATKAKLRDATPVWMLTQTKWKPIIIKIKDQSNILLITHPFFVIISIPNANSLGFPLFVVVLLGYFSKLWNDFHFCPSFMISQITWVHTSKGSENVARSVDQSRKYPKRWLSAHLPLAWQFYCVHLYKTVKIGS